MISSPIITKAIRTIDKIGNNSINDIQTLKASIIKSFDDLDSRENHFLLPTTMGALNKIKEEVSQICEELLPYCENITIHETEVQKKIDTYKESLLNLNEEIETKLSEIEKKRQEIENFELILEKQSDDQTKLETQLKNTNIFQKLFHKKLIEQSKEELTNVTNERNSIETQLKAGQEIIAILINEKQDLTSQSKKHSTEINTLNQYIQNSENDKTTFISDKKKNLKHLFNQVNKLVEKNDNKTNSLNVKILLCKKLRKNYRKI